MNTLQVLHMLAGLVVLAEASNKLERSDPCARGLTPMERFVEALKVLAWALLALSAGGAVISPVLLALGLPANSAGVLLRLQQPTLAETCALLGFAVLIIRTRFKEG